jgi:cobalt/nickel transport system permease protein
MHMADALLSPAVGGVMFAATGITVFYSARKVRENLDQAKIPLMGVLGAFIFAAQMVNFTIPGTGSSGHLGGGLILSILLGPYAAFLVMASVLAVQALFFADGGLLALGANIFNLGFFPAFIAFPLLYRPIAVGNPGRTRLVAAAMVAAVVGLSLGAFGVVLETTASGISALPFGAFVAAMLPIHLAIGIVEGLVTTGVVLFVKKARPELLDRAAVGQPLGGLDLTPVLIALGAAAVIAGGVLSWFASTSPDGLEWSIAGVTGAKEFAAPGSSAHEAAGDLQKATSILPKYSYRNESASGPGEPTSASPTVESGKTVSGLVGGAITLVVTLLVGLALRGRKARQALRQGPRRDS